VLIDPWPYIVLIAMIFTGVIGGSVGDRKSGRSPGRLAVVGALGGGAAGIGLILLGIALPNVHLELQPQSEEEELEPLCSQYLDPDGYRPTAGSVFDLDQEPLLSWTPLSSLPDVDLRWRIDLLPPNGDMHSLTTSNTSLSFAGFNLSPLPTERFRWRLTSEVVGPEGDGWEAFCAPTDWLPFSFKPPAQEETPEDTPTPSPTPTQTPTTTVTLTTTPTPTPEMCVYTALQNANCRASDYMESAQIAVLLQGETAELIALNPEFTHGKFELQSQQQCWIWLGLMDGPPNPFGTCGVPVVDPPPKPTDTPTPFACSPDLDKESCEASGGEWTGGTAGAPSCTCPR
ncbi:MAG: hypothetical protein GTO14_14105, partial [Anaerolineales bacterium]|nr:hypothetical protein [Anaerolineales bacterium]